MDESKTSQISDKPTGFVDLQTPADLLSKLKHDLDRINTDLHDSYAAFDFFVTAEHIIDWKFPDTLGKNKAKRMRQNLRNSESLLGLVSDIANGAKHFQALADHHKFVKDYDNRKHGGFDPRAFDSLAFDPDAFAMPGIHVKLSNGRTVHITSIARKVVEYWENNLASKADQA